MDKLAEEIFEQYRDDSQFPEIRDIVLTKQQCLEAMQSYHEAKLKEELLKFNSWMCGKQYDGEIPLIRTCIDEYLKQHNNGNNKT
jgi:hypothetical protein